jgi:hypothetical protein
VSLADFVGRLSGVLDAAGIPHMFTGSFASTFHGISRTTQAVDIVVSVDAVSLARLLASLPDDAYYVSEDAARDALRRRSQFNVIDLATGWKADLIVQKMRPFSQEELRRRERRTALGVDVGWPRRKIRCSRNWNGRR